jgi:hypothetical protein
MENHNGNWKTCEKPHNPKRLKGWSKGHTFDSRGTNVTERAADGVSGVESYECVTCGLRVTSEVYYPAMFTMPKAGAR